MGEEVIIKFKNREGTASDFYEIDEEEVKQNSSPTV
jgi:ABC-type phosphate transport system auxiliary subunit